MIYVVPCPVYLPSPLISFIHSSLFIVLYYVVLHNFLISLRALKSTFHVAMFYSCWITKIYNRPIDHT